MNRKNYGESIISFASALQRLLCVIGIVSGIVVAVLIGEILGTGIGILSFAVVAGLNILLAWALALFMKGFGLLVSDTWAIRQHFVGNETPDASKGSHEIFYHNVSNCPYCNKEISAHEKSCSKCGAWQCSHCGNWNPNGKNRCSECDWAK